ncbi:hypothetical protein FACS18945_4030 [Bacteroidia bacterium]|nr:hypothetical protein FACS18945_4030 [Bacteroidia bacterium]
MATNATAQVLTPGSNPSPIVKLGEGETFTLKLQNPASGGTNYTNAQLDIILPATWKFVSSDPRFNAAVETPAGSNIWRISGLSIPMGYGFSGEADIAVKLVPLCAAQPNTDKITWQFNNSTGTKLKDAATATLSNFVTPILNIEPPQDLQVTLNTPATRTWKITEMPAGGAYVKGFKVDIACNKDGVKLTKVEVNNGGGWVTISTAISTTTTGYTYIIKAGELSANSKFEANESLQIRETLTYADCSKSGNMTATLSYGDGTAWCAYGSAISTKLLTITVPFSATLTRGTTTFPSKSDGTGNGKMVLRVVNNSTDANAILKDVKARIYNYNIGANKPYIKYLKAYFSNNAGTRIAAITEDIPISSDGIPGLVGANARQYIVNFDQFAGGDISASVPALIDTDGDGVWDDVKPNSNFYFTVEYTMDYNFTPTTLENNDFSNLQLYYFVYYKNECNNYVQGINNIPNGDDFTNLYVRRTLDDWQSRTSLSQSNIHTGDKLNLTFSIPPNTANQIRQGFLSQVAVNATYNNEHWVYVTLPDGFRLDPDAQTNVKPITISGNVVAGADISVVASDGNGITSFKFRNRVTVFNGDAKFNIPLVGVCNGGTNKNLVVHCTFNFVGDAVTPYPYGQMSVPMVYNCIEPCSTIELLSYSPERTTFGWTDGSKTTSASKATGARVDAAGPYDNVSHIGNVVFHTLPTLTAGQKLLAQVSYISTQNYFTIPDANNAASVTIWRGASMISNTILTDAKVAIANSGNTRTITADLTDYYNALKGVGTLQVGDVMDVVLFTRTTETLPTQQNKAQELKMNVYTDDGNTANDCTPILGDLYLWDYKIADNMINSGNGTYNANSAGTADGVLLRWEIGRGVATQPEFFTNEYRPNATLISTTEVLNGLYEIQKVTIESSYGNNSDCMNALPIDGTSSRRILPANMYTVTYNNGKTTVTINNLSSCLEQELWANYSQAYRIAATYRLIGGEQSESVSVVGTQYPTSENPVPATTPSATGRLHQTRVLYNTDIIGVSSNAMPLGSTAQWTVQLVNSSSWIASDKKVPHSWIALEAAAGVLGNNVQLYAANGTTLIGNFTKVEDGKYWIRVQDNMAATAQADQFLTVNGTLNYVIKSDFTACEGLQNITVKFGFSQVTYPSDPWKGYDDGDQAPYNAYTDGIDYNTAQVYNTVSTGLTLTAPNSEYTTQIALNPDGTDAVSGGLYDFCSPITIEATYTNALTSELNDLSIEVPLPLGLKYNNLYLPKVKVGNGAWATYTGTVSNAPGLFILNLGSAVKLAGIGSNPASPDPNSVVKVKFQLKTVCDFEPGQAIFLDVKAQLPCGSPLV